MASTSNANTTGECSASSPPSKVKKFKAPKEFKSDTPSHHHPNCPFTKWNTSHRSSLLTDDDVARHFTDNYKRTLKPCPTKDQLVVDKTKKAMKLNLIRNYLDDERKMFDRYKSTVLSLCVCKSAKLGVPWDSIPDGDECDSTVNLRPPPPPPSPPPVVMKEKPIEEEPEDNPEPWGTRKSETGMTPYLEQDAPPRSENIFSLPTERIPSPSQECNSMDDEESGETNDMEDQSGGSDPPSEEQGEDNTQSPTLTLNVHENEMESDDSEETMEQEDNEARLSDSEKSEVSVDVDRNGSSEKDQKDLSESSEVPVEPTSSMNRDKTYSVYRSCGLDLSEDELDYTDC